ncbi:hypothetical protein J1N35_006492 [Gossypium stocksii]|uniref:Uncharacterized protein n=1 Tax=Gossypium stocksii TaxID=47602 RepID=A0A9D4AI45_9ROSI|nr:hypothetical protein J1N35_006492 [Gossypium stocksii]
MSETPNRHRRSSSETPNRIQRRPSQIVFGSFSDMPADVFYDSTFDEAPPSKVARLSPRPPAPSAPAGASENVAKDDEKPNKFVFGSFGDMSGHVFYHSTFNQAPPSKVARVSPPPLAPPAPAWAFENVAKDDEKPKNAKA